MKLTAAQAASYFGAEVICAPYGGQPDRKIIGTMIGLNNHGIDIKFPEWQSPHQIAIDQCQLILTPLDKISDEDAVEVAKIILSKDASYTPLAIERNEYYTQLNIKSEPDITDADTIVNMYIRIWNEDCNIQWVWEYCKNNHIGVDNRHVPNVLSAYDYLRSKGYDCGHGSIPNLIAAGVAVEKEIL